MGEIVVDVNSSKELSCGIYTIIIKLEVENDIVLYNHHEIKMTII